jgi:protease IV
MTQSEMPVNPPPPPAFSGNDRVIYIQAPAPATARRSIWRSILVYAGSSLIVFSVLMNFVLLSWFSALSQPADELRERYVSGSFADKHKVAIVDITGVISEGDGLDHIVSQLKRAREDKSVVGVVLEVNSPGGSVTASDIILHEVERTKKAGKRVVVWMGSLAASGGYYVSCKADEIYASPTSLTGSIGVIMSLFNVEGLSDKIGLKMRVISCGKFKEMGSPFREMTEEERAKFQGLVESAYARFKKVIAEGRGLSAEEADEVADGAVITPDEALKRKLIDKVDYLEVAVDNAKGGFPEAAVVRYHRPGGLLGLLSMSQAPSRDLKVRIETPLPNLQPGLYYLWMPGLPTER